MRSARLVLIASACQTAPPHPSVRRHRRWPIAAQRPRPRRPRCRAGALGVRGRRRCVRPSATPGRRSTSPCCLPPPPISAGGDAGGAGEPAGRVARAATAPIAVVVGDQLPAGSSELPAGRAAELANEALASGGDDTVAVLTRLRRPRRLEAASGRRRVVRRCVIGSDDDGGHDWLLPAVLVGGAGVGGALLWRRRRSARPPLPSGQRAEAADRELLRAELSVLADDVVRLEPEVQLHPRRAVRLRRGRQPLPGCASRPRRR